MYKNCRAELLSLFVEGQPIVFEVYREENCFHFEPLFSWKDNVSAVCFCLERADANWIVNTTIDKDLFYQAVEEIEIRF